MPKVAFHSDLKRTPKSAEIKTHNRWHPDIPLVETFKTGAEFRVECFDWTGGQIAPDDSANDVRDVDLTKVHYLSGPFGVEGAEPGDLMVVDLLDIGYLPDSPWGFTGIFAKENGGGFLVDHYPQARKAIWDYHGIYCELAPHSGRSLGRHRSSWPDRLPPRPRTARAREPAGG